MQFQVPQFIEVEDRILGPLTFKQFIYLVGGAGISFVLYVLLPFFFAVLLILPIVGFSLALARASSSGKRAFDIVASGLMFIATLPIMLLTAVTILFVSRGRGTVIYRQVRVGRNGEPFQMYKFRSMREDAEGDGKAHWAAVNDDRVTRVCKFIRATRTYFQWATSLTFCTKLWRITLSLLSRR